MGLEGELEDAVAVQGQLAFGAEAGGSHATERDDARGEAPQDVFVGARDLETANRALVLQLLEPGHRLGAREPRRDERSRNRMTNGTAD